MSSKEERGASPTFKFKVGELVLVKWEDGMVYFAKIKKIDEKKSKCVVIFDDKSQDDADFSQIHSVDETTTDIICIKCKRDESDYPNEIVLCDSCGIGFHQRCHNPAIPASALDLDTPWNCIYCQKGTKCPYLTDLTDTLENYHSLIENEEDERQQCDVGKGEEAEEGESTASLSGSVAMDVTEEGSNTGKPSSMKKRSKKSDRGRTKSKGDRGRLGSKEGKSSFESTKKRKTSLSSEETSLPVANAEFQVDTGMISTNISDNTAGPSRKKRRGGGSHGGGGYKKPKTTSVEAMTLSVTRVPILTQQGEEVKPCTLDMGHNPNSSCGTSAASVPTSEQEAQPTCITSGVSVATDVGDGQMPVQMSGASLPESFVPSKAPSLFISENTLQGSESLPAWEKVSAFSATPLKTALATVAAVTMVSPTSTATTMDCPTNEVGTTNSPPDSPKLVIASPNPTTPPATGDVFVFPECTSSVSAVPLAQGKPVTSVASTEAAYCETKQPGYVSQPDGQQSEIKADNASSAEKQQPLEDKCSLAGCTDSTCGIKSPEQQQVENKQLKQPVSANLEKTKTQSSEAKHCNVTHPETRQVVAILPERPTSLFGVTVAMATKPFHTDASRQISVTSLDTTSVGTVTSSPLATASTSTAKMESHPRTPSTSKLTPSEPGMGQKTSVISVGTKLNGPGTPTWPSSALPVPLPPSSAVLVTVSTSTISSTPSAQQGVPSPTLSSTTGPGPGPSSSAAAVGATGAAVPPASAVPISAPPPPAPRESPLLAPPPPAPRESPLLAPPPPAPRESPLLAMMASRGIGLESTHASKSSAATSGSHLNSPSVHKQSKESDDVIITGESKKKPELRKGGQSDAEHSKDPLSRCQQGNDMQHASPDATYHHHHSHRHHHRAANAQGHSVTTPTADRPKGGLLPAEKHHTAAREVDPSLPSPYMRHSVSGVPSTLSTQAMASQFIPITYMTAADPQHLGFQIQPQPQQQQQQQDRTLVGHLTNKVPLNGGKSKPEMVPSPIVQSPLIRQPHHSTLSPGLSSVTTPLMVENASYLVNPAHQGYPHPTQLLAGAKEKASPPPYSTLQYSHVYSSASPLSTASVQTPKQPQVCLTSVKQQGALLASTTPFIPLVPMPCPPASSKDHPVAISQPPPAVLPAYIAVPSDAGYCKQQVSTAPFGSSQHPASYQAHAVSIQAQGSGLCLPTVLSSHKPKELTAGLQPQESSAGQVTFTNSRPHMSVNPCTAGGHASSPSSWHQQMGEMADSSNVPANKPFAVVLAQPSKGSSTEKVSPASCEAGERGTPLTGASASSTPGSSKTQLNSKLVDSVDGSVRSLSPCKNDKTTHVKSAANKGTPTSSSATSTSGEQAEDALRAITKNIQDAFVESNEKKLMAAFEDAWKKFQANGKKYEHVAQQVKKQGQPIASDEGNKVSKVKAVPKPPSHHPPQNSSPLVQPSVGVGQGQGGGAGTVPTAGALQVAAGVGHPAATPSIGLVPASASSLSSPQPYYVVYASPPSSHIHLSMPPTTPELQIQQQQQQQHQQTPVYVQQQASSGSEYAVYAVVPHSQAKNLTTAMYFPSPVTPAYISGSGTVQQRVANPIPMQQQSILKSTEQLHAVHMSPSSAPIPIKQASTPNQSFGQQLKPQPSSAPSQKSKAKNARVCSRCGNEATYLCSGCQQEWYCGRDCQLKSWDSHSENCKA